MRINDILVEFAPSGDGGGSGDYFQALASAWYNGTFDTGSLQKGIKSQQDVEQLLQRGIIGPDGVTRKYGIDYNSTFDGVVISSDDYYEHADHDETDSRTGKPFGPYDYMEFGDEELDESLKEGVRTESAELAKQYGWAYNQGEYGASMTHPKHGRISLSSPVTSRSGDTAVEREWTHNNASGIGDRSLAQHLQSLKEQGVAEATGDEKFDTMMGQIQREPKYPDSQMPPTDVKDLYQWAIKNNKPYHKIFAEWANREGYKSVAPALQRAGDLDTEALDYWTPRVWKIYWGEVRGIDSEMPPEWSKKRVPDELRDYLETVFDAYDRIVFDWPTEYRQIGGQDNYAEGDLNEKSTSQAQFRTMAAAAHDPKFAKKVGIKQSVAREFNQADTGQDYKDLPKKATEGATVTTTPGSIEPGGAVDNFKQQMANNTERDMAEGNRKPEPPEADYGDDYQDMVSRVKKLAGLGPLKTVYDPQKRVYKNMPTATQPKK